MNGALNVSVRLDVNHINVPAIKVTVDIDTCGHDLLFARLVQGKF